MGPRSDLHYISRCYIVASMTISKCKSNHNVVYSCKHHVVWCPKYRRSVLNDSVQKELKALIEKVCGLRKSEILAVELMKERLNAVELSEEHRVGIYVCLSRLTLKQYL
jgi:hypothetical protein